MITWSVNALLLLFIAMGIVTMGQRLSFIALADRLEMPAGIERALTFVAPAVLAALVIPDVLALTEALRFAVSFDRAVAFAAASVVAWRTENMVLTIAVGMGVLWLIGAA